jgi:phosphatidylinositol glycan class M
MNGVRAVLWAGVAVRLVLIAYGEWHDSQHAVKYTDVDFEVFSDAATSVWNHGSPYARATYRYTPLLAWILAPLQHLVHRVAGKLIFCAADIGVALVIAALLQDHSAGDRAWAVAIWLLNPLVVNVSTRGNAESVVALCVLAALLLLRRGRLDAAALVYALAIHVKIYPILFALALFLGVGEWNWRDWRRVRFGVVTLVALVALTAALYQLYGYEFLYESYLYHIGRSDPRHNFSLHFYMLYLHGAAGWSGDAVAALAPFLPQVALVLVLSWFYCRGERLYFGLFALTAVFVVFNKVCTVQYFVWYFSLLPLVLPALRRSAVLSVQRAAVMFALWLAAMALWLLQAYRLEFLGENTYLAVWFASVVFFSVNIGILCALILAFGDEKNNHVDKRKNE